MDDGPRDNRSPLRRTETGRRSYQQMSKGPPQGDTSGNEVLNSKGRRSALGIPPAFCCGVTNALTQWVMVAVLAVIR